MPRHICCFSPFFCEVKLIIVYHPLHVQVIQAGSSFQCIPNIYGKLYCARGGVFVDSYYCCYTFTFYFITSKLRIGHRLLVYKCMVFCCHDDEVEEEETEI